jgi:hypothetical protein
MPSDPRPDRYRVSLSVRVKEEQIERVRSRPCFALVGVLHQQEIDPHRPLFDVFHSVLRHQKG